MSASPERAPGPIPPPRSAVVTLLAWLVIGASGLLLPISYISLLMVLAGSYGTSNIEPIGALVVLAGPTATLVAGIGLLRRRRWAWRCMVAVLTVIVLSNFLPFLAPSAPPVVHVAADGLKTTVVSAGATGSLPLIAVAFGLLITLLSRRVRSEFPASAARAWTSVFRRRPAGGGSATSPPTGGSPSGPSTGPQRGWRTGHLGRDRLYYEERRGGAWQRIEIDGEMLMGRPHHVIHVPSPERWRAGPEWARGRRDEILARIRSEFREPDYEYDDPSSVAGHDAAEPPAAPDLPSASVPRTASAASAAPVAPGTRDAPRRAAAGAAQGMGALVAVAALCFAMAGAMGWLAGEGLLRGETPFPSRHASQGRGVSRAGDPAMFWTATGLYVAVGLGAFGFAVWLVREGSRLRGRRRPQRRPGND